LFGLGRKIQSAAIRAVTKARRPRAVVEDMAQMAAAFGAVKLSPHHAVAGVRAGFHRAGQGVEETGPACATVELCRGIEQFGATAGALELAGTLFMVQGAGARALGAVFAQDAMLFGGQGAGLAVGHGSVLS